MDGWGTQRVWGGFHLGWGLVWEREKGTEGVSGRYSVGVGVGVLGIWGWRELGGRWWVGMGG